MLAVAGAFGILLFEAGGIATIVQCPASPRSQSRKARFSKPGYRADRSWARRCSRGTGMLLGWIT